MALLDDLKRKAQQVKDADSENQERLRRDALYEERFKQPMVSILHYLSELTEQLRILDYEARHSYTLPGIGEIPALRHNGYVVNADSSDNPKAVRVRFNCTADSETEYAVTPKSKADETRSFLESQKMRYTEWPIRDHEQRIVGLNFQLRTEVKASFLFQADLDLGSIKLFISNFNDFKLEKSLVQPEMINEAWLDNLGNFLLRKRADLYDLDIDESHKIAIRRKLAHDARRREEELQQVIQNEQVEREEEYRRSILGRLKTIVERMERQ
ncbi:MAG: hypothetical protein AB2758_22175 [Candidatus Thiodiazotropha endolucinida]